MIKETIESGRKEAESLKSVIMSGEILKLDYESQQGKLKEYEERMEKDMKCLPPDALKTYYAILHKYFNDLLHDTMKEDSFVSGTCGLLDSKLTLLYIKRAK